MTQEVLSPLILAASLLAVLIFAVRMLHSRRHVLTVSFFAFAIACSLFSVLYWIAYDILRPDARMPFAANEICEWALFLLLASSLRAAFPDGLVPDRTALPAVLFTAANAALWIAWSGEWVQDILTAVSFGWFLSILTAGLRESDALSRAEWIGIGAASFLLVAVQGGTFFVPAAVGASLDLFCFVLLFAADVWLILKTLRSLRKNELPQKGVCLAFAAFAWSTVAMYMSAGWAYTAALILTAFCYPLMLLAIRKEVAAE